MQSRKHNVMSLRGTSPCPLCLSATYTCPHSPLRLGPPGRSVNIQLDGSRLTKTGYGSLAGPLALWCLHLLIRIHPMNDCNSPALEEREGLYMTHPNYPDLWIKLWPAYLWPSVSRPSYWEHSYTYSHHNHFSLIGSFNQVCIYTSSSPNPDQRI